MSKDAQQLHWITRGLRHADESVTSVFDRAFAAADNPWRHLGALAFSCLVLTIASGVIGFALYDTSVEGAYQSGLRLQNDPMLLGRLLRGIHRYGADACLLLSLLHLLREAVRGHYAGVRWFSWLTGIPLLWLIWVSGLTGLWLLWDARALYSITATAEWLQALPIGAELLARNFLTPQALNDRFFSLVMFVHIGVPLLSLAALWIHVQRVAQARLWPPAQLLWPSLAMLTLLSLLLPVTSLSAADFGFVPQYISLDWFYQFFHPLLDQFSAASVWWMAFSLTLLLSSLPLLLRPRVAGRRVAVVDLANCNGCARCAADCPFGAISMVARSDGSHHRAQAMVDSDMCAACGICVGACPSSTPFRSIEDLVSGIELPDLSIALLRGELKRKLALVSGAPAIVVFSCRQAGDYAAVADERTVVIELECAAMLPPSFLEYTLRMGAAGAVVAGCREGDCEFRLGDRWVKERLLGLREPHLRVSVPRERIALCWAGRDAQVVAAAVTQLREQTLTFSNTGYLASAEPDERHG